MSVRAAALAALCALCACNENKTTGPHSPQVTACDNTPNATTVSLPVGGVQVLAGSGALDCVGVTTSDGTPGSFVVVTANADTQSDAKGEFALVDSVGAGTLARIAGGAGTPVLSAIHGNSVVDARLRAQERALARTARARGALLPSFHAARAAIRGVAAAVPGVGDTLSYNVPDPNADNVCDSAHFTSVRATVKFVGTHGIILQDVAAPSGGFTAADFAAISNEFDNLIYPADTVHFGSPSDIDGNGHVLLLYTPRVNAGTPRGSKSVLEGFFFGGDLFPPSSCHESNLAEIFYLIVPDDSGKFGDARSTTDVRQNTRGTIAHEFQHMINAGIRIIRDDSPDEAGWLNEGLSHFAEELVGRAERGFSDTRKLAFRDIDDQSSSMSDLAAFFGQNILRFREWLIQPDRLGATSSRVDSLAVRGAAWALLRWTADHYAGGNVASFTRALVAGPEVGVANLAARADAPFDTLMVGWMVANVASDAGIPNLDPRYTYTSWNMRDIEQAANNGVYPLSLTPLTDGQVLTRTTDAAAGDYFQLSIAQAASAIIGEVSVTGEPVTYNGARLYILRTQ
jgi:hypothetical protein